MREQLIQYVNLLFAGAPNACDIKEEILQNTLDRYDDLISQGKSPEAAYSLAISGIGDINEVLGTVPSGSAPFGQFNESPAPIREESDRIHKRILRAVAIALFIICPTPLFVLGELGMDTIGLCGTLSIVAVATVLLIFGKKTHSHPQHNPQSSLAQPSPRQELRKSIDGMVWAIGLAAYFVVSFLTNAWYITWVIFPMIGAVSGLIKACVDLKEASRNEI